ncbi:hypothetical protein B0H17DRAFT_1200502 [Mycena rosella]|uniref:RNase H type-1 domain-containing protein n=1 Tax=Mycena rosella TaxID=1033263 RepID=A0AAD7DJ53_MYCRO|nr:hypothetical protein B0H17DRAFT_1200502 [Mycena rosella]
MCLVRNELEFMKLIQNWSIPIAYLLQSTSLYSDPAIVATPLCCSTPRLLLLYLYLVHHRLSTRHHCPRRPEASTGQHLLTSFHSLLRRFLRARPTLKVRMHWVPAHVGIVGDEAVDARMKEAAQGASSPLASCIPLPDSPLPTSRAVAIAAGTKVFNARWLAEWTQSPRFRRLVLFD